MIALILVAATSEVEQSSRVKSEDDGKTRAASLFDEGQSAQERGDLAAAVRIYTSALALDDSMFQAHYQRGVALLSLGRIPEAEADLRKVISLRPDFARAHRALGLLLLDKGMTDEAKSALARALELDRSLTGVRLYYASALLKSGDPARAAAALKEAIQQGEANGLIHALLGVAEERSGNAAEAFAQYERSIALEPNQATAREGRGRLLEARGEIAKAIEDYSVAYRAQPNPDLALQIARLHRKAGQQQAALGVYRQLTIEKPGNFELRAEMIRLMVEMDQTAEAVREIEAQLATKPDNHALLTMAGDIYAKDQPEMAAGYYRRALDAKPDDNRSRIQLAASLVRSKQYLESLPLLEESIRRDSGNYQAHANLATALFELKQYPRAAHEFLLLIRARPDQPVAYYFFAICVDRLGDCQQALRGYKEFINRADSQINKKEIDDARIRVTLLEKLAKDRKCKSAAKANGK